MTLPGTCSPKMRRGGLRSILRGTEADLAKRKAAELAALKLGWNKLEEHVGKSMLLDLDQDRSVAATAFQSF
jgi:hypothetical protein